MALNPSGPISLGGSTAGESIALELGLSATGTISLNDTAVRGLAGVASGAIVMPTDFWGKSNIPSGALYMWGSASGAFFSTSQVTRSSPVQVSTFTDWTIVTISGGRFLGLRANGTMWGWGGNAYGVLGLNNTIYLSSPVQVGALTTWAWLSQNAVCSAAIKSDGTLWSWGRNTTGSLGHNDQVNRSSPTQVGALTNWSTVATGGSTLAIKTDGTLWAWGQNFSGALGLNDNSYRSSPVQVGASSDWAYAVFGGAASQAIKTNGTLWAWGIGSSGRTGLNIAINVSSPTQVGALTNWKSIKNPWGEFQFAHKTDGTLWAWGANNYGQLGISSTQVKSSPVQVGALTDWTEQTIAAQSFSHAVKSDGTLWGWGRNRFGTVGNNTQNNYSHVSSPTQIGALTTWKFVPNNNSDNQIGAAGSS